MNPNIQSLQYCRKVFGMTGNAAGTLEKSEIRFLPPETYPAVGLFAEVTRMIGQWHSLNIDPISIIVESTRDSMYLFIKFDHDHGASTVEVLKVIKP
jgi:hypothetical protein